MSKLVTIAKAGELGEGQGRCFEVDGRRIAVFNVGGAFFALDDTCPHSGGPLSEGEVIEGKVVCPWHAASFDLKTGDVLTPPAFEGVQSYKVVVEGDEIKVQV